MNYSKRLKTTAILIVSFFVLIGCKDNIDNVPKVAVQKSLQQLSSQSFDFEMQLVSEQVAQEKTARNENSRMLAEQGSRKNQIERMTRRNLETELMNRIMNATTVSISGSVDKDAETLTGKFLTTTQTRNVDLSVQLPFMLNLKKSEAVLGLYDFNGLLFSRSMNFEDMDKAIRIEIKELKNQVTQNKQNFTRLFEQIDPNSFSQVKMDEVDETLGGKRKIQLILSESDFTKLTESNNLSKRKTDELIENKNNIFYFTLDKKGNLVRLSQKLYVSSPVSPVRYNVILSTVFKKFGSLSIAFSPKEEEIVNLKDDSGQMLGGTNYQMKQQITRVYGEMSAAKTATEAALFEGKIPVASKAEAEQDLNKNEWIGWAGSTFVDSFVIYHDANSVAHKNLVATLGQQVAEPLQGTQLVLTRTESGVWQCTFYTANKPDLDELVPKSCKVLKGSYQQAPQENHTITNERSIP